MNFKQYLQQVHPARVRGVKIRPDECEGVWPNVVAGTSVVSIDVAGEYFTYVTKKDSGLLWTTDEDGNPKSPSCFILQKDGKKKI